MYSVVIITHKIIRHIGLRYNSYKYIESFASGSNAVYLEDLYDKWEANPQAVHASWAEYFKYLGTVDFSAPALSTAAAAAVPLPSTAAIPVAGGASTAGLSADEKIQAEYYNVYGIIKKFRDRGHFLAKLDPLELPENFKYKRYDSNRIPNESVFAKEHLAKQYLLPANTFLAKEKSLPLSEIIKRCKEVYCQNIGLEYSHIDDYEKIIFLRQKLETPGVLTTTKEEKLKILQRLSEAHGFEAFLSKKWPPEKRFGLEGCDAMIPCVKALIEKAVDMGVEYIVLGIAHRGRLNTLANICKSPLHRILMQFMEYPLKEKGVGDVKYHLGISVNTTHDGTGKPYKISMVANPSHLELVNTVVMGKTKAEQFYKGDPDGKKVMSILIHGDAAFSGEGIVFETLNMSKLPFYNPQGVIHIIVNNQVGFTTNPSRSRSALYCTDVAKIIHPPIFHVNADKPEECVFVGKLCAEYRQTFLSDTIIDLIGYRRNGHNESDEPKFTQPLMYDKIRAHEPVFFKYGKQLVAEKVVTEEQVKELVTKYDTHAEAEFQKATKQTEISLNDWNDSPWTNFPTSTELKMSPTGISEDVMKHIGKAMSTVPDGFEVHSAIKRILKSRDELLQKRTMDWAMGEAFAFGSLLKDGVHCRLSGEDAERGTFSHRHHVLHHQKEDKKVHIPLKGLFPNQAEYTVTNSCLCEMGVLAFELGYSLPNPNSLVIWEAQFGDFANMAQAIFDTFIASGETKWIRQSGLVMLLPHGMEGQGPEHSSARLERFLELCCEDEDICPPDSPDFALKQLNEINWIVANCTTPANVFHAFRRQLAMPFRKPLVLMTPKSLLRHPMARSSFDEVVVGTEFQRIIPENGPASKNPGNVKKLIFCCGKVYYDILGIVEEKKLREQIAIARFEQCCPFPFDLFKKECAKYSNANIFYAQEEHKNQGAYHFMHPRMMTALDCLRGVEYIGREVSATTANGNKILFKKEVKKFAEDISAL